METSQGTSEKIKLDFKDSKYATGRRKTSIAKVWLKKGSGKIYVNGKNYENYFKKHQNLIKHSRTTTNITNTHRQNKQNSTQY